MVDTNAASFSVLSRIFGISGKKILRWYQGLSGFFQIETQKNLHKYDIKNIHKRDKTSSTKTPKRIETVVLKEENFGDHMTIDEKHMGGEFYTILANKITGKIAVMVKTVNYKLLEKIFSKVSVKVRYGVKTISKDCSSTFDLLSRTMFLNAQRIADKFHILCVGLEALQDIRIRYKQEVLTEERVRRELHKEQQAQLRDSSRRNKIEFQPAPLPKPVRFQNGETKKEILARGRYLLYKFKDKWSEDQQKRAKILFKEFPELERAYKLICNFRSFYNIKPDNNRKKAAIVLEKWFHKVGDEDISEIQNFASSVQFHRAEILNYFNEGHTNAFAESLNAKLQRFVINNYGIHNRDFFHFRVNKIFA